MSESQKQGFQNVKSNSTYIYKIEITETNLGN